QWPRPRWSNRPAWSPDPRSMTRAAILQGDAVGFVEEAGVDVGLAGVAETGVAPGGSPAVADDEATVRAIADDADRVAAGLRAGLVGIEQPLGRRRIVPGRIDVQPDQERTVRGNPAAPLLQVLLQVEIGCRAPLRGRREELVLVAGIHRDVDAEGQQGLRHH